MFSLFLCYFYKNYYVGYKVTRIPMVIIKTFKLFMFYGIFTAHYYVLILMPIFTFEVCWEIPCGKAFYFSGTIQLIHGASQVSGFCIVCVFTLKNIQADYRFCFFNINKLSCYVIFRKGSCTTDLLVPYSDAGGINQWRGKLVASLITMLQISFSSHMMSEFL